MKCIWDDFRRAITGRWFLIALFASIAALYLSIGSETDSLIDRMKQYLELEEEFFYPDAAVLLRNGLLGEFGIMTLPALSALPFAGQALQEIRSGAIRPALFRVGRKSWIAGKMLATLFSGILLQLMAVLGLLLILHLLMQIFAGQWFPMGDFGQVWPMFLRRMICGGIWSGVGCLIALMTETASAAYLAPLCLCYAMVMLGTRFFPEATLLNPMNWLTGATWPLLAVLAALAFFLAWMLRKKVNACV